MLIQEFKTRNKQLGGTADKIKSAYWGQTWWDVRIIGPTSAIYFQFLEDQPIRHISISNGSASGITAESLREAAKMLEQVAALMDEIDS